MKKIWIVFAYLVCISIWNAAEVQDSNVTELQAANFLAAQNIIVDKSYNPQEYELSTPIQRKAVMKIVMKLSWKYVPDKCTGEFIDVPDAWPCKYIESALREWYITANPTFRPDDNITKTEAMKLVLKSKSISKFVDSGNWQQDYMSTAFQYGIITTKYFDYDALATRWWIFQIATATIKKEEVIKARMTEKLMSDEAL